VRRLQGTAESARVILEDTDTEQTVATMVDWLDERKLI